MVIKLKCPRCGAESTWEGNPHRPFCSERCKLIDLGQWATEKYRIPVAPAEDAEETTSEDPQTSRASTEE